MRRVRVIAVSNVDNKTKRNSKCHGEILSEIAHELRHYLTLDPMAVLVREENLYNIGKSGKTVHILNKVIGVAELYGWALGNRQFEEIHPNTVKKILTNNADAEKDEVAAALEPYVGKIPYACDDESDAVAIGVAWLLQQGMLGEEGDNNDN